MDTQAQKLELIQLLLKTNSADILKKVKAVFKQKEIDFWDELSDQQKKAIDRAIKQADNGELFAHEDIMLKFGK